MSKNRNWQGVRLRTLQIGADPDSPPRTVTLPATWDDSAARALVDLAPGTGAANLADLAAAIFRPVEDAARRANLDPAFIASLHRLLLLRRAAPAAGIWRGDDSTPGYIINLAAFADPATGFDTAAYAETIDIVATALALRHPSASKLAIGIADLSGLLARLGLTYDSEEARNIAACVSVLLRHHADQAPLKLCRLGRLHPADWPKPPNCILPSLSRAAQAAHEARSSSPYAATTEITDPGAVEALLGIETGGLAPAYSPVREDGSLTTAAQAWLAARAITPEAALAAALLGESPFPQIRPAAYAAMLDAAAPYLHQLPEQPDTAAPAMGRATIEELPPRRRGYTQKANIAGHKLYLRTGEYEDGRLGEIFVALNKESPAFRGLMDCFAIAVSLGLQHGVPLSRFTSAFTGTKFGAAGPVEGDTSVPHASSLVDYLFRNLAATYLGQSAEPEAEQARPDHTTEIAPLLPLDLPRTGRQTLKLVR